MKLRDLFPELSGPEGEVAVTGLTADSRRVEPGFVFAALQGVAADGRDYIPAAIKAGAVAVLGHALPACDAVAIEAAEPRLALAQAAARFYPQQPGLTVAVTGTNGKSSTVDFLRQIWTTGGARAASMGTLGAIGPSGHIDLGHTTPDPVAIHATLDTLARDGVTHAAMEASSHGLAQYRLDAVRLGAVAFTNLTQDHLDYHPSMEAYFQAKAGLFTRLLPPDGVAVINTDDAYGARLAGQVPQSVVRVGSGPDRDLRLLAQRFSAHGQVLRFALNGRVQQVDLGLVGGFQAANALVALGLVIATGADPIEAGQAMAHLKGVRGRMQLAATRANGAPVFVDYAHTPAAVETALKALRPHVMGRLIIVLGAGGDRDRGKRPLMGAAAAENADVVFVTDDNPRSENPAVIRAEILKACPEATEVGDRAEAILRAVDALQPGDALLIAGKGHETGQTVAGVVYPFDDLEQASVAVAALDGGL